jgi:hypothetical protein
MAKYMGKDAIYTLVGILDIPDGFRTMSQDSYNEKMVGEKLVSLGNPKEILMSVLNISIVGFGNQKFGSFRINEEITSIQSVFNKYNIKYTNPRNAILKEDDLTPQRLIRFYRFHIQEFIVKNNNPTYLYRKYSLRNPKFMHVCFRGAEYLDNMNKEEATYYLETIKYLDENLGTRIQDRVLRVYDARGQDYVNE